MVTWTVKVWVKYIHMYVSNNSSFFQKLKVQFLNNFNILVDVKYVHYGCSNWIKKQELYHIWSIHAYRNHPSLSICQSHYCAWSITSSPMDGFSSNMAQMYTKIRWCKTMLDFAPISGVRNRRYFSVKRFGLQRQCKRQKVLFVYLVLANQFGHSVQLNMYM